MTRPSLLAIRAEYVEDLKKNQKNRLTSKVCTGVCIRNERVHLLPDPQKSQTSGETRCSVKGNVNVERKEKKTKEQKQNKTKPKKKKKKRRSHVVFRSH